MFNSSTKFSVTICQFFALALTCGCPNKGEVRHSFLSWRMAKLSNRLSLCRSSAKEMFLLKANDLAYRGGRFGDLISFLDKGPRGWHHVEDKKLQSKVMFGVKSRNLCVTISVTSLGAILPFG